MSDTDRDKVVLFNTKESIVTGEDRRQALLLATGDLLRTAGSLYKQRVSEEINNIVLTSEGDSQRLKLMDKTNSDFPNTESFKNVICSNLGLDVMFIVWRESDFISNNAIKISGLEREFAKSDHHLTRNSLKNRIFEHQGRLSASDGDALKRSVDRICDALEVYGLIDRKELRPNLKPMSGTKRLHHVMESANLAIASLFARQLQSAEESADE